MRNDQCLVRTLNKGWESGGLSELKSWSFEWLFLRGKDTRGMWGERGIPTMHSFLYTSGPQPFRLYVVGREEMVSREWQASVWAAPFAQAAGTPASV